MESSGVCQNHINSLIVGLESCKNGFKNIQGRKKLLQGSRQLHMVCVCVCGGGVLGASGAFLMACSGASRTFMKSFLIQCLSRKVYSQAFDAWALALSGCQKSPRHPQ